MSKIFVLAFLFVIFQNCEAKTKEEWKSRTIYHLMTDRFHPGSPDYLFYCFDLKDYCGGTFKGIELMLDYISELGFNAILISPIVENISRGYHGYWTKDFFKINPQFGTEEDFFSLIIAAHERGTIRKFKIFRYLDHG
jgi:alpha-amylase